MCWFILMSSDAGLVPAGHLQRQTSSGTALKEAASPKVCNPFWEAELMPASQVWPFASTWEHSAGSPQPRSFQQGPLRFLPSPSPACLVLLQSWDSLSPACWSPSQGLFPGNTPLPKISWELPIVLRTKPEIVYLMEPARKETRIGLELLKKVFKHRWKLGSLLGREVAQIAFSVLLISPMSSGWV